MLLSLSIEARIHNMIINHTISDATYHCRMTTCWKQIFVLASGAPNVDLHWALLGFSSFWILSFGPHLRFLHSLFLFCFLSTQFHEYYFSYFIFFINYFAKHIEGLFLTPMSALATRKVYLLMKANHYYRWISKVFRHGRFWLLYLLSSIPTTTSSWLYGIEPSCH